MFTVWREAGKCKSISLKNTDNLWMKKKNINKRAAKNTLIKQRDKYALNTDNYFRNTNLLFIISVFFCGCLGFVDIILLRVIF